MKKTQINQLITKLFFILLLFVIWPLTAIFALIGIIQTAMDLLGQPKVESLIVISTNLLNYFTQITKYITGMKDKAPYPF
ncbi:DUF4389 domain-containing protein [Gammaproteobacteria bacterium]|nr:DUF4389 domain-containing protein [Gammaproteobacteria bacterium]